MPLRDDLGILDETQKPIFGLRPPQTVPPGAQLKPTPEQASGPGEPGFFGQIEQSFSDATKAGGFLSPENVGGMAGGMLAPAAAAALGITNPLLGAAYVVGGAALGGMGGRQIERIDPRNAPSSEGVIEGLGNAANRQAIGQAGGSILGAIPRKLIDLLGNGAIKTGQRLVDAAGDDPRLLAEALQRQRVAATAQQEGLPMSLSQQTGKPYLAQLESAPARFPLGVSPAVDFADNQTQKTLQRFGEYGGGQSLETTGLRLRATAEAGLEGAKGKAKGMFEGVSAMMPPRQEYDLDAIRAAATEIVKEQGLLTGLANKGANAAETLKSGLQYNEIDPNDPTLAGLPQALVEKLNLTKNIKGTYEEISALRTRLGELYQGTKNPTDRRYYAKLLAAVDEDLGAATGDVPGADEALTEARKFYQEDVITRYRDNPAYERITTQDPSELVHKLIPPRASVEDIRRAKATVSPAVWKETTRTWMQDVLTTAISDPQTLHPTTAGQAAQSLQKLATYFDPKKFSPEVLNEIFDPKIFGEGYGQRLNNLLDYLRTVTGSKLLGSNSSETARGILGMSQVLAGGTLFIDALQAAVTGQDLNKGRVTSALAVLTFPQFMAKALLTPGGIDLLSKGLQINPATQQAAQEAAGVAAQLVSRVLSSSGKEAESREGAVPLERLLQTGNQGRKPVDELFPGDRRFRRHSDLGPGGFGLGRLGGQP